MYQKNEYSHELIKEEKGKIYEIKTSVTGEDIENIVVTALEGGIGYWASLDTVPEWDAIPEGLPMSQYATQLLLEGKTIGFTDTEDDDERWQLDLQKLLKGIGLNMKERPHDADLGNMDSTTADCIVQYALFGEVVYG